MGCWRHWDGSKLAEGIRSLHSELVLIVITTTPVDSHYQTNLGNSDPVSSTQFIEETTETQGIDLCKTIQSFSKIL